MDFISVVATIVGGLCLIFLYRLIQIFLADLHNKTVLKNIVNRDEFREKILLESKDIHSVMFFNTHNRDGRTSHTKDYKMTCVRGTMNQEKKYRDLIVDRYSTKVLLSTLSKEGGSYVFDVEHEGEGILKDIFTEEKFVKSYIHYIKSNNTGVFYAVFSTFNRKGIEGEDDKELIRKYVRFLRRMRNVYQNF